MQSWPQTSTFLPHLSLHLKVATSPHLMADFTSWPHSSREASALSWQGITAQPPAALHSWQKTLHLWPQSGLVSEHLRGHSKRLGSTWQGMLAAWVQFGREAYRMRTGQGGQSCQQSCPEVQ